MSQILASHWVHKLREYYAQKCLKSSTQLSLDQPDQYTSEWANFEEIIVLIVSLVCADCI